MKKVITTAIILVIFSSGSVTLAYGLPVFWGKHVDGMIWSVDISGNGKYMAAGADLGNNRGMVYFIDKDGNILWSQEEDRIIGKVSLSRDGSYVLASGYQIKGGAGQVYANPSVYLFDQSGKLLWNFQNTNSTSLTPDNQFFGGSIDPLGKNILILADYQIFFLDRSGNLLWNHKMDGRDGPNKISEDGSTIAIGTIHDKEDNVWELTVFDNLGNLKWRYKGIDGIVQGNALAISSDGQNVVIGSMASGEYGNLYKFDKTGNIIWQRNNVPGGVLNVDMSGDGSSIVVGTNNGMLLFNGDGEEIASDPTWYPTISSDGKSIASSGLVGDYDYGIAFFDGKLNPIWRIPNAGSDVNKISKDGTFIIAGTRLPDYTSKSDDLYFFEGQQKSATEQFFNDTKLLSPRAQFEKGVAAEDIICKEGLELIIKAKNHSPACVKPETKTKLIQRGWAINDYKLPVQDDGPVDLPSNKVKIILSEAIDDLDSGVTFHPPYVKTIMNSNNTVTWINENATPVKLESDEGYFSTEIQSGESFSFTFDKVGIHRYHSPENWKHGAIMVSTEEIESSNLETADLFKKNPDEIANTIAPNLIPDDKIIKKRLDNTLMSAYVTEEDADIIVPKMLCLLCDLNSYNPIEYRYGMTEGLVYPKDESDALDFAKDFLIKIGYNMDGSEWIDKVNFGDRIEVSIQQRTQGWIIPNHFTRFEFYKDQTWISLGRWYNDISGYEFKLSQDDAKKVAKEYMDIEVKNNPNLQKYEYKFESISDGVRVIIFDDKPLYAVPISYKASAKMNYENGHCGGPEFFTAYVMVEGQKGAVLGWDYPGCM